MNYLGKVVLQIFAEIKMTRNEIGYLAAILKRYKCFMFFCFVCLLLLLLLLLLECMIKEIRCKNAFHWGGCMEPSLYTNGSAGYLIVLSKFRLCVFYVKKNHFKAHLMPLSTVGDDKVLRMAIEFEYFFLIKRRNGGCNDLDGFSLVRVHRQSKF